MSLERAEADLAQARAEVRRYEQQLESARQRALKLEHYVELARHYAALAGGIDDEPRQGSKQRGGASVDAVRVVIGLLREAKRPIKTRDLLATLRDRGIVLGGPADRQVTNLSGYLSRNEELVNDRATGWSLKEWTASDANCRDVTPAPDQTTERLYSAPSKLAPWPWQDSQQAAAHSVAKPRADARDAISAPRPTDIDDEIPF